MPDALPAELSLALGGSYPTFKVALVTPLEVIDTILYEFYKEAPTDTIAIAMSIAYQGFSPELAEDAAARNLKRCVTTLLRREPDVIAMAAVPLYLYLTPERGQEFLDLARPAPLGGHLALEGEFAAIETLGATRIGVINKWDVELNRRLREAFAKRGFEIVATASEPMEARDLKGSLESGTLLALRLVDELVQSGVEMDCIYMGGGAWLSKPLIPYLEDKYGIPIVAGVGMWHLLNLRGTYEPVSDRGRVFELKMNAPSR